MNRLDLLPSVNWNASHILVINSTNTMCAFGTRGDIVVIKNTDQDDVKKFENKFIPRALKNCRVMGLTFVKVEVNDQIVELLASCGDDGRIKVWDVENGNTTHRYLLKHPSNSVMKLIDIDCFPETSCIVSASDSGTIVKWNLNLNKLWTYTIDIKIIVSCIEACPHDIDLIAIGAHHGLVLIYSLKGEGKLRHKIRCHDTDVFSVSWCPVPYNSMQLSTLKEDDTFDEEDWKKKDKTLLLASCAKDRSIYVCKAGLNGYCEAVITLPPKPLTNIPRNNQNISNFERARYIKWINPFALLTFTDFNEIVIVDITSKSKQNTDSKQKQKVSHVNYNVKFLHNIHKRSISNFAVYSYNSHEVDFRVWSCSADRLLVRSGYRTQHTEKPIVLPLLSGHVFSLEISPTNPDLLAIGTGDGKISILNLSTDTNIDITTLSKRIDSKVMSLQWHPYYEGVLAFGTCEGRVGLFDISQGSTTPTIFKLYHNKPIYKLCWGPPIFCEEYEEKKEKSREELYLFAVGHGDVLQYNPSNANKVPVSLNATAFASIDETCNCKIKTDLAMDPDRELIAIGLNNGDICLCSVTPRCDLVHVIIEQPKPIMSLAWHPRKVFDNPNEISPCCDWLATAGQNVLVYETYSSSDQSSKKVASLEVHTNRILSLAWNPHTNGRLLSCSADNSAIIWDVLNQTIIGRYTEHCAQINCGIWSPCNKDYVITGSADFTCRIWSISKDTMNKINDSKKKNHKIIEPTFLNPVNLNESVESVTSSYTKTTKPPTCLPSVSQALHLSPLLETVFEKAIRKHKGPPQLVDGSINGVTDDSGNSNERSPSESSQSNETNGVCNEHDSLAKNVNSTSSDDYSYAQLFGDEDVLMNLVRHEERVFNERSEVSVELCVLSQSHFDLKSVIVDAMKKNQITEYLLALAPSVSPKLWKDACQVYIEQLIQSNNILQAVSYQLALGKDEEAIALFCEKNQFKEAFVLSRLRSKDETVTRNVLEKWIKYCYNCGVYRLAAHCYMFLEEEQSACTTLNKSKLLKDTVLAAKLFRYYEPNRAFEAVTECVKRNFKQLSSNEFQDLLNEFPEIKFVEPWYLMMRYFNDEKPNTSAIMKWLIGLSDQCDAKICTNSEIDFKKLENIIVDNTFNMNYDQLTLYVSAQAALYISGISDNRYKNAALRHYIRGLFHCYNFKMINSNQIQSDCAYPMMRLLQLIFANGIACTYHEDSDDDETSQRLRRSINAYFCDFAFNWLISCDELPKSLKLVAEQLNDDEACLEPNLDSNKYKNSFSIIRDSKIKLEKSLDLLKLYVNDILDADTATYFKNVAELKQFENGSTNVQPMEEKWQNLFEKQNSVETGEKVRSEALKNDSENTNNMRSGLTNADVKKIRESIDEFEKQRVSAPNPYYFFYLMKDFVEKHKYVQPELAADLDEILITGAQKCGIVRLSAD